MIDSQVGDYMGDIVDAEFAEHCPALHAFTIEHVMQPGYDFGAEFDFGLGPDPRPTRRALLSTTTSLR